jgi:F0F1-type ATP synthase assembly protein I
MIKSIIKDFASKHNVSYAEAEEIFYSVLKLVSVVIIGISVVFFLGYYLGTLKNIL